MLPNLEEGPCGYRFKWHVFCFYGSHMKNIFWSFSGVVEKNIFPAAMIISPLLSDNGDNTILLNVWVNMKALADGFDPAVVTLRGC